MSEKNISSSSTLSQIIILFPMQALTQHTARSFGEMEKLIVYITHGLTNTATYRHKQTNFEPALAATMLDSDQSGNFLLLHAGNN